MRGIAFRNLGLKNVYGRGLETNGDGELFDPFDSTISTDIIIHDVRALDGGTKNIHVRRSAYVTVSDCIVDSLAVPEGAGPPVNSDNCSAFEASGSQVVTFTNCIARHKTVGWGVSLRAVNGSRHISFENCMGRFGRQGASIADVSHVSVIGCQLIDTGNIGISVESVGNDPNWALVRNIKIIGNTIINPTSTGLNVSVGAGGTSIRNAMVQGNTIEAGANAISVGLRVNGDAEAYESDNLITPPSPVGGFVERTGPWLALGQVENTFTPALTFATPGDLAVTAAVAEGYWRLVGKMLFGKVVYQTSAFTHSTASGDMRITGLPFTALSTANRRGMGSGSVRGITKANFTQFTPIVVQGTTYLNIRASGSGQVDAAITTADMPSGGTVRFELWFSYEIN